MTRKLLLAITICCLSASSSFAQFGIPRGPKCLEVGYTYGIARAQFSYQNRSFNESTGILTDTGYTEQVTSKGGFGALVSYYWPVATLGPSSKLAITAGYMYNAYLWEAGAFAVSSNSRTGTTSIGSGTVEMALPIGADFKSGCDAMFDKSTRTCFSFGAGVYPTLGVTVFKGDGGASFKTRPYIKAEAGFFAGICFKLRAMYVMGAIPYINYEDSGAGYFEQTTFKSRGTLNLSLVVMPMSWKWGRTNWWGS